MTRTSMPPGPASFALPFAYGAYAALGEPVLDQAFARYGKTFSIPVPGMGRLVVLADPALVPQVLQADPSVLDPTEPNKIISVIYGAHAIVVLSGDRHIRMRRLLLPPLRGQGLQRYREMMIAGAERTLDRLPIARPFPLLPELHAGTMEVILQIVLGIDDPARLRQWIPPFKKMLDLAASEEMTARYMLSRFGGLRFWGALHRTLAECDALIYTEIACRRAARIEDASDLLSLLMAATTEDGGKLSDIEIRDNIVNLLVAGHETSATGLAWAFHWALRDPATLARLVTEAHEGVSTEFASAVAREAIRLCPPFIGFARQTLQPYQLGDYLLPAGTIIGVPVRHLHRDRSLYADPDTFRPERFIGKSPSSHNYLSFGAGVHRCLGDHFAVLEIAVFLQTMLRRGCFELPDPQPEALKRKSLVNVPAAGCLVRLARREEGRAHAHQPSGQVSGCPMAAKAGEPGIPNSAAL